MAQTSVLLSERTRGNEQKTKYRQHFLDSQSIEGIKYNTKLCIIKHRTLSTKVAGHPCAYDPANEYKYFKTFPLNWSLD